MLPMFYQKVGPLNTEKHKDHFIEPLTNFEFARKSNSIVVGISEFAKAAISYPVVFVLNNEQLMPVAVTGLKDQQNLFIDPDGQWLQHYIPAYIRRYPFIVAAGDDNKLTICIDESYSGLNQEEKGKPLFNGEQQSDFLQQMIQFIKDFEDEMERSRQFCKQLQQLDILEESHAVIEREGQEKSSLTGFLVVSREKLNKLPQQDIYKLQQNGSLELIYNHLLSVDRFNNLFQRAG